MVNNHIVTVDLTKLDAEIKDAKTKLDKLLSMKETLFSIRVLPMPENEISIENNTEIMEERLAIRVSPEFKQKLQLLADNDKRNLSDFIRKILEDYVSDYESFLKKEGQIKNQIIN